MLRQGIKVFNYPLFQHSILPFFLFLLFFRFKGFHFFGQLQELLIH